MPSPFWTNYILTRETNTCSGGDPSDDLCAEGNYNAPYDGSLFTSDYFTVQAGTFVCNGACSAPLSYIRFTNTVEITGGDWTMHMVFSTPAPEGGGYLTVKSDDGLTDYSGYGTGVSGFATSGVLSVQGAPTGQVLRLETTWGTEICIIRLNAFVQNGCFIGETLVRTPSGDVPIESIVLGNEVVSFDRFGEFTTSIVTLIDVYDEREAFEYTLSNGVTLTATDNHRVLIQDGRFLELRYLKPTDRLVMDTLDEVSVVSSRSLGLRKVFNLKGLDGNGAYLANGVRVSNISYVLPEVNRG